jgi:hypothetical protein
MAIREFFHATGAVLVLACLPHLALAQWVWKDDQGHTVYSDQAPPSSVPLSRILKQPGRSAPPAAASDDASKDDAAKVKSVADQDLDFKKRQKDSADAAKKSADEGERKRALAEHCTSERQNLSQLQSGTRLQRTDDQGNRYFVDDATRAADLQRAQSDLSKNCQ